MSAAGLSSLLTRRCESMARTLIGAAAVAALCLGLSPSSKASHYRLAESGLVTEAERASLVRVEVRTTADLVERAGPKQGRKALAGATRIALERLWDLAQTCDLLRVKGLGMSMAKLLRAAGVSHTGRLAREQPAALAQRLKAINGARKVAPITPDARQLAHWIAQAKSLRQILEAP